MGRTGFGSFRLVFSSFGWFPVVPIFKLENTPGTQSKFLGEGEGEGVVDGEGGSSERWLKWGGVGWGGH